MRPSLSLSLSPSVSLYTRIINLPADRVSRNPIKIFASPFSSFHINYGDSGGPEIAADSPLKPSRGTLIRRQCGAGTAFCLGRTLGVSSPDVALVRKGLNRATRTHIHTHTRVRIGE